MNHRTRVPQSKLLLLLSASLCTTLFSGCGMGVFSVNSPASSVGSTLQGRIQGGQQPVSGALISLYAAGLGVGPVDLLAPKVVTTNQNGNFTLPTGYTCPAQDSQLYLVARGGNPGLKTGTNNPALVLMAALGDCSSLTESTFISVNEVTTAASSWALAQFLGPNAAIGASSSNKAGLRNAFQSVRNLVSPATGIAPGPALPPGALTETAKLYSLANSLASCVNSDGAGGCAPLFSAATTNGNVPSNTLDAALNIVRNPGNAVAAVYDAGLPQAPFQSGLAVAPSDWTLSITYGVCGSTCGGLNQPGALAIDSTGSVWVANYFGGVVSRFLPNGTPAAAQGYSGTGLRQSYGVAIDPQDNAWITNETSVTGANNSHLGSVSKFNISGAELSGYGFTGGGIYYPQGIASDASGRMWVADYGDSSASFLANDGSPISPAVGDGPASLPFTPAVAVDGNGNGWFAVQEAAVRVTPAGAVSPFPCCVDPAGIAIDQAGKIWLADYGGGSIVELTPSGAVQATVPSVNGFNAAQGIAIDGSGQVWAANFRGDSITELAGLNAAQLSPADGFGLDAPLNEPRGLAIDASGNLWTSNAGGNTLTQFLGLARPIRTPLLGPPANP